MNAKLTPGLMAIALLVLTIYGPLAELRSITTADLIGGSMPSTNFANRPRRWRARKER